MHPVFMKKALELARQGRLTVSPNPMVGCLLVKDHQVIGEGFHFRAGDVHAEIHALRNARGSASGATAYITLEPCAHYGKTPPCTEALIQAGVKKVFIAVLDPNPLVCGKGVAALRMAGIEVEIGLCETQARHLNEIFFHYMTYQRPFVISKWAMSLDGKTGTHPDDHRQISGPEAGQYTHQLRQQIDAILIGANTLRQDNPKLTVRLPELEAQSLKHPVRIVLAGHKDLPSDRFVFDPDCPGQTWIATTPKHQSKFNSFSSVGILILPEDSDGYPDIRSLLNELGKREITSLLIEGGMTIHQQFFKQGLINRLHVYLSPVWIGNQNSKYRLVNMECHPLGEDFHFSTYI